jgi:Ca2+-binding EF-hand superfamily protein
MDREGAGYLGPNQILRLLNSKGIEVDEEEFRTKIFPALDMDSGGEINFLEYLAGTIEYDERKHLNILKGVFQLMDADQNGERVLI